METPINMIPIETLDISLVNSITSDNLKDITIEGAEIALDLFLEEGVLKQIPFFGTFYKGFKATMGIRESIFAKKVFKFLSELKDIPKEKRVEFVNKLDCDDNYQTKVGEKLIILIEQLDDIEKPKIIGRLLKSSINEEIEYETFLRLSSVVQKSFLPDLLKLKPNGSTTRFSQLTKEHFAMLGLMSIKIEENTRDKEIINAARLGGSGDINIPPILIYELNELAGKLIKYGLT